MSKRKSTEAKVDKMAKDVVRKVLHPKKANTGMKTGAAALVRTGGNFAQIGASSGHEKKYIDTSISSTFNTTGAFTLLNACVPGSDAINRIGRRIKIKSILVRMYGNMGSTPANDVIRFMLVVDKQANAAAPAVTDILVSASSASTNNLNNRARFVSLLDWIGVIDQVACTIFSKVIFLRKDLITTFNAGSAGTIADIQTGSLYALQLGINASGTSATTCVGRVRVRFEDD